MKKFLPVIVFVVVFAAVLAGQIGYKLLNSGPGTSSSSPENQTYEELFLHASYKSIDGKTIEMTKLNAPVVIYNFWASWCMPCLEEMPSMIALKKKFQPDQVQIVAINTDEEDQLANIQKTIKKINLQDEFIIVPDSASKITSAFKITAIPVTIIFHRGKVVHVSKGPMDFNSEEIVEKMKEWTTI